MISHLQSLVKLQLSSDIGSKCWPQELGEPVTSPGNEREQSYNGFKAAGEEIRVTPPLPHTAIWINLIVGVVGLGGMTVGGQALFEVMRKLFREGKPESDLTPPYFKNRPWNAGHVNFSDERSQNRSGSGRSLIRHPVDMKLPRQVRKNARCFLVTCFFQRNEATKDSKQPNPLYTNG
ncbi:MULTISPECIES: hypothetical protein [Agrobacterium]|uniref:hypothetical protein n=1 Tax=Agrobacterium TaxID=357 RepID=UPI000B2EB81B|nr:MULTISPECIES: hypothetical protein [Agrobacterium]